MAAPQMMSLRIVEKETCGNCFRSGWGPKITVQPERQLMTRTAPMRAPASDEYLWPLPVPADLVCVRALNVGRRRK